jgi:hypothetical protein
MSLTNDLTQISLKACTFGDEDTLDMLIQMKTLKQTETCLLNILPNQNDPSFGCSESPSTNFISIPLAIRLSMIDKLLNLNVKSNDVISRAVYCNCLPLLELAILHHLPITSQHIMILLRKYKYRNPHIVEVIMKQPFDMKELLVPLIHAVLQKDYFFTTLLIKKGITKSMLAMYEKDKDLFIEWASQNRFENPKDVWTVFQGWNIE